MRGGCVAVLRRLNKLGHMCVGLSLPPEWHGTRGQAHSGGRCGAGAGRLLPSSTPPQAPSKCWLGWPAGCEAAWGGSRLEELEELGELGELEKLGELGKEGGGAEGAGGACLEAGRM